MYPLSLDLCLQNFDHKIQTCFLTYSDYQNQGDMLDEYERDGLDDREYADDSEARRRAEEALDRDRGQRRGRDVTLLGDEGMYAMMKKTPLTHFAHYHMRCCELVPPYTQNYSKEIKKISKQI